jgi:hypothetical protein
LHPCLRDNRPLGKTLSHCQVRSRREVYYRCKKEGGPAKRRTALRGYSVLQLGLIDRLRHLLHPHRLRPTLRRRLCHQHPIQCHRTRTPCRRDLMG